MRVMACRSGISWRSRCRNIILMFPVLVLASISVASAESHPYKVLLLLSGNDDAYARAADSFTQTLLKSAGRAVLFDIKRETVSPEDSGETRFQAISRGEYEVIVPIGTGAAQAISTVPAGTAILNILTTKEAYEAVWADDTGRRGNTLSAIYLEQPIARQIRFIQLALPRHKRCGVILGKRSLHLMDDLGVAAESSRLLLTAVDLSAARKPIDGIKDVLGTNDVILAVPDAEALTPNIAKWLLYMAYQKEIPVIGFSKAFVDAGALGAIFTTPEQIGRQAAEIVLRAVLQARDKRDVVWKLPPPQYPVYFNVEINDSVARSLKLILHSDQHLAQSLIQLEQAETWRAQN